jgi:hypothetical protein
MRLQMSKQKSMRQTKNAVGFHVRENFLIVVSLYRVLNCHIKIIVEKIEMGTVKT